MKHTITKVYIPKDHRLFSWDPENMKKYWEQCNQYDRYPLSDNLFGDNLSMENKSQDGFRHFLMKSTQHKYETSDIVFRNF